MSKTIQHLATEFYTDIPASSRAVSRLAENRRRDLEAERLTIELIRYRTPGLIRRFLAWWYCEPTPETLATYRCDYWNENRFLITDSTISEWPV